MEFTVKKCLSVEFITGYSIGVTEDFCKICNEKFILSLSKSHLKNIAGSLEKINIEELVIRSRILFGNDFAKECLIIAAKSGVYNDIELYDILKKIEGLDI